MTLRDKLRLEAMAEELKMGEDMKGVPILNEIEFAHGTDQVFVYRGRICCTCRNTDEDREWTDEYCEGCKARVIIERPSNWEPSQEKE